MSTTEHKATTATPVAHDPTHVHAQPDESLADLNQRYDVLKQTMPGVTIALRPIAPPMALGLAAFFSATWIIGTWYADWYGSDDSFPRLGAFVMIFGGIAQFIAGMACFPARDNFGTVFHGTWGAFFISWGIMSILSAQTAAGFAVFPLRFKWWTNDEFGMIFVTMAAIDLIGIFVTLGRDLVLMVCCLLHFIGDILFFAGFFSNDDGASRAVKVGGWFWLISSVFALYRSLVWLVTENFQYSWLPTFATAYERAQPRVRVPVGEPGVKKGQ